MNQKDTIIVAALLNAVILAVLFMMAATVEDDGVMDSPEIIQNISSGQPSASQEVDIWAMEDSKSYSTDEVDDLLKEFVLEATEEVLVQDKQVLVVEDDVASFTLQDSIPDEVSQGNVVHITVKKGDSLDKIARTNRTTIEEIKSLNHLRSERLSIGQELKVPIDSKKRRESSIAAAAATEPSRTNILSSNSKEPVYYTIKSGDNPWKIAKECRVKMDELLRLNNLDEAKARRLKVGDQIRIR